MKIPLYDSELSSFLLMPSDIEHMDTDALGQYYEDITQSLLKMNHGQFLKIYFNHGDIYACTDAPQFTFSNFKTKECPSILRSLLGENIPLDSVLNCQDHLKLGGKYLRFFRLKDFPQEIFDQGNFNELGRYFMAIRQISKDQATSSLDRKRKIFRSNNAGEFANYKSEEGESQAEELLAQIQLNTEGLFEIEFWFWVIANTEDDLGKQTDYFFSYFKHSEGLIQMEDLGLSEAFINFVPEMSPTFVAPNLCPSSYALGLMPLSGDYLHKNGMPLQSLGGKEVFFR